MITDERTTTGLAANGLRTAARGLFDRLRQRPSANRDIERGRAPLDFGPGQAGYAEYECARSALLDAEALVQSREGTISAALLYRAAIVLFGKAHHLRESLEAESPAPERRGRLDSQAIQAVFERIGPERRERLERILALTDGEATLAQLEGADQQNAVVDLQSVALELAQPLERDATQLKTRLALGRLRHLLPWLLGVSVGLAVLWNVFARTNLALHSEVSTTSGEPNVRANPRALVDGDRKNLGFHTKKGRGETATIDLGSIQPIQSVEIYNRYDCCQNRAVPLRLEVSTDGVAYEKVARRTDTFSFWKVSLSAKPVRFLRLTDEATNFFHLSEVEVY